MRTVQYCDATSTLCATNTTTLHDSIGHKISCRTSAVVTKMARIRTLKTTKNEAFTVVNLPEISEEQYSECSGEVKV